MKEFFLKHPNWAGILIFILVMVSGSALGLVAGVFIVTTDTTPRESPSDPHDGAAMASAMIFSMLIMASLFSGIIAGLITTYILQSKQKQKAILKD